MQHLARLAAIQGPSSSTTPAEKEATWSKRGAARPGPGTAAPGLLPALAQGKGLLQASDVIHSMMRVTQVLRW